MCFANAQATWLMEADIASIPVWHVVDALTKDHECVCDAAQATFEDELIEDAKAKRHSLTCEAVEIGRKVRRACD